jgi:hypothetical protein
MDSADSGGPPELVGRRILARHLNVARARKPDIPKRDAERALTVLKYARKTEPKYGKPNSFGAYLMFLIGLAIAGLIVYYALNHKEQITQLWYQATHRDSVSVPVHPDQ